MCLVTAGISLDNSEVFLTPGNSLLLPDTILGSFSCSTFSFPHVSAPQAHLGSWGLIPPLSQSLNVLLQPAESRFGTAQGSVRLQKMLTGSLHLRICDSKHLQRLPGGFSWISCHTFLTRSRGHSKPRFLSRAFPGSSCDWNCHERQHRDSR